MWSKEVEIWYRLKIRYRNLQIYIERIERHRECVFKRWKGSSF